MEQRSILGRELLIRKTEAKWGARQRRAQFSGSLDETGERATKGRKNNVTKRSIFKSLGLALGCAGLVFATAAVYPHRTVPIGGTFGTTFKLIPTATPGVFDDPIEGGRGCSKAGFCTRVVGKPWISEPTRRL